MRIAQIFGSNLKRLRKDLGIRQSDLCESMKISIPTLIRWEKGENMPREEGQIDQLAEYLNVPPESLFKRPGGTPEPETKGLKLTPKQIIEAANELAAKGEIVIRWKPR